MVLLNPMGQLLLPLVGVKKKLLEKYKVEILNVGFKYREYSTRTIIYTLFIRIKKNERFLDYLRDNVSLLKYYEIKGEEQIVMLECLPEHAEDWNIIIRGKYSKVSAVGKAAILSNLGERKEDWRRVFNKNKEDILNNIKEGLKHKKPPMTPMKRHEVAMDLLESVPPNYEMYKKLKKNFV